MTSTESKKFPFLNRAPITEAIVDIRARPSEGTTLDLLKQAVNKTKDDYPIQNERRKWESKLELKADGPNATTADLGVDGFLCQSADQKKVAQFRLDGFTFSHLKPYPGWDAVITEAKRLWTVYRDCAKPVAIERVAVRYINIIQLPLPLASLNDYLKSLPNDLIPTFKFNLNRFIFSVAGELPDQQVGVIATQALEPVQNLPHCNVIFDIDVFKPAETSASDDLIWASINSLREIKNQIFFEQLTDKTIELLK